MTENVGVCLAGGREETDGGTNSPLQDRLSAAFTRTIAIVASHGGVKHCLDTASPIARLRETDDQFRPMVCPLPPLAGRYHVLGVAPGWIVRVAGRGISMRYRLHGRRSFVFVVAGIVCAGLGAAPARAQTPPLIIPQPPPIIVDTSPQSPLGIIGDEKDEIFTGQVTGRADVDLDVDTYQEEGQATAR